MEVLEIILPSLISPVINPRKSLRQSGVTTISPVNFSDTGLVRTCSVDCFSKRLADPDSINGVFRFNAEMPIPLKEDVSFPSLAVNILENPYMPSLVVNSTPLEFWKTDVEWEKSTIAASIFIVG